MNCAKDKAETVMWTTDQHMAYYNLPPMMVEHWSYVHELNGYLMDVVRFLSTGYKTGKQPLNPLAPEYIHQNNKNAGEEVKDVTDNQKTNQDEWINNGRMFRRCHSVLNNNNTSNENINPYEVLSGNDAEERTEDNTDDINSIEDINPYEVLCDNKEEGTSSNVTNESNDLMSSNAVNETKDSHKWNYNVDIMTKEEIDEIIRVHDESRPEGFEYMSEGEGCIRSEYNGLLGYVSDLEFEVEQHRTTISCNAMQISTYASELKYQQQEYEILDDKLKQQIEKCHELDNIGMSIITQLNRDAQVMRDENEAMKAENHEMRKRLMKLEEAQKGKECEVVQLKAVDAKSDEISNWTLYKRHSKKYAKGSKEEERRCRSKYKVK